MSGGVGEAGLLGLVQGLTEFLPVSSSGHLVLLQQFFEPSQSSIAFDLALHVATLVPIVWLFREDVIRMATAPFKERGPLVDRPGTRMLLLIVVASIPTAAIGLLLEDVFETLFSTPGTLLFSFATTGGILWSTRGRANGPLDECSLTFKQAFLLGAAQGAAITPGISRSGTTIATALLLGADRGFAARFSFLLSIPAILGGFLLKVDELEMSAAAMTPLLVGMLVATVSGYIALKLLVGVVNRGNLSSFSWYCWVIALVAGAYAFLG